MCLGKFIKFFKVLKGQWAILLTEKLFNSRFPNFVPRNTMC